MKNVTVKFYFALIILMLLKPYVVSQEDLLDKMRRLRRRLSMIEQQILTSKLRDTIRSKTLAERGIVNKGMFSEKAIERQLFKALYGFNVSLFIFGESVSVGADLGKRNNDLVFHSILGHWWDLVFNDITNSRMLRHNLAIGGVGTSYFGRCWQEYLKPTDTFDLAVWEFNINDVGDKTLVSSLEFFTHSLYERFKKLDLVFTIFFRRSFFDNKQQDWNQVKRHELAENIVARHAHRYNITCFNIEPLLNHSSIHLGVKDLFKNIHPTSLAHTQMAFIMITYYTDIMTKYLDEWIDRQTPLLSPIELVVPRGLTTGDNTCQNICWTGVTPNFYKHIQRHSLFSLPISLSAGFTKIASGWTNVPEKRFDITGGYRSVRQGSFLTIYFPVHHSKTKTLSAVSVAIKYLSKKSITYLELGRINVKATSVTKYSYRVLNAASSLNALTVYPVGNLHAGFWVLKMKVLKGDFLLCAIIIC